MRHAAIWDGWQQDEDVVTSVIGQVDGFCRCSQVQWSRGRLAAYSIP